MGLRWWLKLGGIIILGGIVALIVFLIIGGAFLEWGIIGGFLLLGGILLLAGWLYDRRQKADAAEWEELGTE